jgi:hypothetical protein
MALNFVTFNQDNTVLGVGKPEYGTGIEETLSLTHSLGTSKGFRLYTTEPFSKSYENEEGDVAIMEMLFSTSLVALILSPRLLRILNTKVGGISSASTAKLFQLIPASETNHDLRTHLSDEDIGCEDESKTPGCRAGRLNLPIRHQQHEAAPHHRNLS